MITLIYGPKGSGKTKKILDATNNLQTKGSVTFFGSPRYTMELKNSIRFVDPEEFDLKNKDRLVGFVLGLIAGNYDIGDVCIDGLHRVVGEPVESLQSVFESFDRIGMKYGVNFTISVTTGEKLPEYLKKYI